MWGERVILARRWIFVSRFEFSLRFRLICRLLGMEETVSSASSETFYQSTRRRIQKDRELYSLLTSPLFFLLEICICILCKWSPPVTDILNCSTDLCHICSIKYDQAGQAVLDLWNNTGQNFPCLIICIAIGISEKLSCILHLQFISHSRYVCNFCYDIQLASYATFALEACSKPRWSWHVQPPSSYMPSNRLTDMTELIVTN